MQAANPVPEGLRLENQLCFPLYACAKEIVRRYREPPAPLGPTMKPSMWTIFPPF